jgi:hypothetical protein
VIALETGTFILILLASALVGALIAVLPAWRSLMAARPELPVWGFLRRRGVTLERAAALHAEMRCGVCGSRAQCMRLLAARDDQPVPGCLNSELFQDGSRSAGPRPAA